MKAVVLTKDSRPHYYAPNATRQAVAGLWLPLIVFVYPQLAKAVGTNHNTSIVKDCRGCCAKETKKETVKYARALLEVCKGRLYHFPEVKDFLNKHAKAAVHKKLKVCRSSSSTLSR